ncbi:unnamed protein product [Miscanthus lutarioriparius]|uniref:Carbohydrate kinase PfkB domain-containing protein n=1 Tax=Miscanthus lutarioriparius TaxID=422564 RepID=A0A811MYF2_9POAL|nr:unnamed protein product [Miscanthus lutarioriparius]
MLLSSCKMQLAARPHPKKLNADAVDFSGMVDDEFLERLSIEKGTRKVINHEERGQVLRAMDGCSYKAAAGGSLSNSLVALARLGSSQSAGYPELKIAMAGSVGSDPLGSFYRFAADPDILFLHKPLEYWLISCILFNHAFRASCAVLMCTSCLSRDIVGNYADMLFANANGARAFCELPSTDSPMSATRYLSHSVPLVSVTDGMHGSYIGVKGEAIYIPPPSCIPVDTCGAGDAYASGILYGILRGASDLKGIGLLASRVAAVVIGQQGTRLRVQDADGLAESFAHHLDSLEFCSDV